MDNSVSRTPEQMRAQLHELSRWQQFGESREKAPSMAVQAIVRNCLMGQRVHGWSGEDTYTMMAWALAEAATHLERAALAQAMTFAPKFLVCAECPRAPS